MWGTTWGEWAFCSTLCGDGTTERIRAHTILAQFGGQNCTGNPSDTKSCNVLVETKDIVAEQKVEIQDLKNVIAERKAILMS